MVYGIGETVLDILFRDDQPQTAIPGGSTFNAMVSLGRCGIPCQMLCQTGDDHVGDLTLDYLKTNGVGTGLVSRVKDMQSHLSLAFLDEQMDAHYTFYKDHRGWDVERLMQAADSVCFTPQDVLLLGSFFAVNPRVRPVVELWLQRAWKAGAMIYYDLNYRSAHQSMLDEVRPLMDENIQLATVVRASADDLRQVGMLQGRNWILTDGANPIRIYTRSEELSLTPPSIQPVSTVGAGDNFNAGFIACYQQLGLTADASRWSRDEWLQMTECGVKFGQQVCMSLENSVAPSPER